MKFIFVAIIVSAMALNLNSCLNVSGNYSPFQKSLVLNERLYDYASDYDPTDRIYFSTHFNHVLREQYFQTQTVIVDAWNSCCEFFRLKWIDEAIDIFRNPPLGDKKNVTKETKCLYHCILTRTGVMTNAGFQEARYMTHIKQLRFNLTSFDVDKKRMRTKLKILRTIKRLAVDLNSYRMQRMQRQSLELVNWPIYSNDSDDLIRSYARAAHECKTIQEPENRCEEAWSIIQCVMERNREQNFDSPFYPLWVKETRK